MCKTIITGIRPTGIPHIGNYLGSIKPILDLQNKYNIFQIIADVHAISHVKNSEILNENVQKITACYLSCGLDIEKTVIWRQSQMREMGLIAFALSNLTDTEQLDLLMERTDNKNIDIVSYMYPILMATDTLMVDPDYVFAGIDHKKNMKFIYNIATRFNMHYGNLFKVPKPLFPPLTEMVKGIDGRKMSKSFNNTISILETEENLYDMITNPKYYETDNREDLMQTSLQLLSFFNSEEFKHIEQSVIKNEIDMKQVRYLLFININRVLKPIREKFNDLMKKPEYLDAILANGLLKVKNRTEKKMQQIFLKVGF